MIEFSGWAGLVVAITWLFLSANKRRAADRLDWAWWILLGLTLLSFRWPMINLLRELHPDESQLMAGAITLRHDPVFWRSLDGATAGPLDYYALIPASLAEGPWRYATARMTALVLTWATVILTGETLALLGNRLSARVATLPFLAFEAFTSSIEFIHYSTELVPMFLIALVSYLLARQSRRPSRAQLWAAGLIIGVLPFAKLQAAPIAAMLGLLFALQEFKERRNSNVGRLAMAGLLPSLAIGAFVSSTGLTQHLVIPYFLQNKNYIEAGTFSSAIAAVWLGEQSLTNGYLAWWMIGSVAIFILFPLAGLLPSSGPRLVGLVCLALLGAALFSILVPMRGFHHYLNFMFGPGTLVLGTLLIDPLSVSPAPAWSTRPAIVAIFLGCCLLPAAGLRATGFDPYQEYNSKAVPESYRRITTEVKRYARAGEPLAIWGWRSSLYVETGMPQATRQAHIEAQDATGPWQTYFLRTYLQSIQENNPPIFVDATGPGNFRFVSRAQSHERFAALREWIKDHYTLAAEFENTRLYVRNDRYAMPLTPAALP